MRVLLDSHALLWWVLQEPSLSRLARSIIEDTKNSVFVSAASGWEIATKVRFGKLPIATEFVSDFSVNVNREGFQLLAITADHAVRAGLLPGPHRDPFDRMLIAQSQSDSIPLVSNEKIFDGYGIQRIW